MGEEILEFVDVGVRRGATQILSHVNWRVEAGQRWVVLGANGAGKTTLLQMAAAREFPTTGTAAVLGHRLGTVDLFSLRPLIGYNSSALAAQIDGNERVLDVVLTAARAMLGAWRRGIDAVQNPGPTPWRAQYSEDEIARAHYLLEVFGVSELAERRFGTLSEGERKRVQCARALMTDPQLLLMDEPGAGLDLGGREALLGALWELAATPTIPAIVLVTHQVETIPRGFTHALLLHHGQVVAQGPIADVITSAHLSAAFGVHLNAWEVDGRWVARAAPQEFAGRRSHRRRG